MKINVNKTLVKQVQKAYPEIQRASATDVVDWSLRLLVKQTQVEKAMEAKKP